MQRTIKHAFMVLMTCLMLSIPVLTVHAEDKSVEVNISSELRNCTVWVTPKDNGVVHDTWNVAVISPTNEKYICVYSEKDGAYYCSFDYISAGEWYVEINAEETIPQVQIAVRTTKQEEGIGNVTISKEIAGLQIYVVDNKVVASWTDDSVGNVYVEIFDTDTFLILAQEKVKGKSYECEFSDTVKKVTVRVVPANMVDNTDAGHTVTLNANYEPKGEVKFNDTAITNDEMFRCTLMLKQSYGILAEINGYPVKIYDSNGNPYSEVTDKVTDDVVFNADVHDIYVKLLDSKNKDFETNDIKIYLVEENGSRKSFTTSVDYDILKPSLTISYPPATVTTNKSVITVTGTAMGHDDLMIGTENVIVNGDGTFTHEYRLSMGVNTIEIVAKDKAGNETVYTANVTLSEVKQGYSLISYILTFVLYAVIGVVVYVVYKKFKKPREREEENNE